MTQYKKYGYSSLYYIITRASCMKGTYDEGNNVIDVTNNDKKIFMKRVRSIKKTVSERISYWNLLGFYETKWITHVSQETRVRCITTNQPNTVKLYLFFCRKKHNIIHPITPWRIAFTCRSLCETKQSIALNEYYWQQISNYFGFRGKHVNHSVIKYFSLTKI